MDRIVITDESLNSYGFRVLSSGAHLNRFLKNPVMLYSHQSWGLPIGKWKDLAIENDKITAEPDFDSEDEQAMKIASKYERGYLNSVSCGLKILATSDAEEDMLPGQTYPTVTKWELFEVSFTPLPANGNAIRLYDLEGKEVNLEDSSAVHLALHSTTKEKHVENQDTEKLSFEAKAILWLMTKLGIKPNEAAEATQAPTPEAPAPSTIELAAQLAELNQQLTASVTEISTLKAAHQAELQARSTRITELEAEVKRLSSMDAEEEAEGHSKGDQKKDSGSEIMLPETLAAIEYINKIKPKK